MKKFTFGIVGLGGIAKSFATYFQQEEAVIGACASRSLAKAQAFAQEFNIPQAYGTYDEMLADPTLDAIYIGVPNLQHFDYCQKALTAGKHVLCEKAITMNPHELAKLVALADEKNLILQEAMTIFNMPLYQTLKEQIQAGKFGKLKMIQAPFGSYKEPDPENRFFNPALGGGALLDIGTYAVSFARYFLSSQPELVASTMLPFATGVDEQSMSLFRNEEDEMAAVLLTFQAKMPKVGTLALEKAYITIPEYPRSDTTHIFYHDGTTETLQVGDSRQAMNYEISNFITAVKTGKNHSLTLTQDVIALLGAMQTAWHKKA